MGKGYESLLFYACVIIVLLCASYGKTLKPRSNNRGKDARSSIQNKDESKERSASRTIAVSEPTIRAEDANIPSSGFVNAVPEIEGMSNSLLTFKISKVVNRCGKNFH
jgi:hypothetical protein